MSHQGDNQIRRKHSTNPRVIKKRKPQSYVSPVRGLVVELAAVRHAAGHAEALAQGPGGHVDEAEPGETGSSIILDRK